MGGLLFSKMITAQSPSQLGKAMTAFAPPAPQPFTYSSVFISAHKNLGGFSCLWVGCLLLGFGFFSPFLLSIPLPTGSQRNEQAAVWRISCWPELPLNTALSSQALLWLGSTHTRAGLSSFQLMTQVQVPVTSPAWALMVPLRTVHCPGNESPWGRLWGHTYTSSGSRKQAAAWNKKTNNLKEMLRLRMNGMHHQWWTSLPV